MNFSDYQQQAMETAVYPNRGKNIDYPTLGLIGEAGELANQLKKVYRDDGGVLTPERKEKLIDETGDCLWYAAAIATELKIDLGELARRNLAKLQARQQKGAIRGDARPE